MFTEMTSFNRPDGWISVSDRLPETMEKVLVYDDDVGIAVGFFAHHTASWFVFNFLDEGKKPTVTHWRELPDPPIMEECSK